MLDFEALRRRYERARAGTLPRRDTDAHGIAVTRRSVLLGLAATTFLNDQHALLASTHPLAFHWDGHTLTVRAGGRIVWTLDPSAWSHSTRLRVGIEERRISASLRGTSFPGTDLSADFRFTFERTSTDWTFVFEFPSLGVEFLGDLRAWLAGDCRAAPTPGFGSSISSGAVRVAAGSSVSYRPDGSFHVSGPSAIGVCLGKTRLIADEGCFAPYNSADLTGASFLKAGTSFSFRRGAAAWDVQADLDQASLGLISVDDDCFDQAVLEASCDSSGAPAAALLLEAGSKARGAWVSPSRRLSTPEGDLFRIGLTRPSVALGWAGAHRAFAVSACFDEEPSWLAFDELLVGVGARDPRRLFHAAVEDGHVLAFECRPDILRSWAPVDGAAADVRDVPGGRQLSFVPDAPRFIAAASNPDPFCSLCTGTDLRLREFSVSVRRPRDLLALDFDFVNLEIERRNGRRVLRQVDTIGPAFVIVGFPPQHIAEEAFSETAVQCGPGADQVAAPPIRSRVADESRLVFRIPPHVRSIPFTIEGLLDWSEWQPELIPEVRHSNAIAEPNWNQTSIEVPYRIFLGADAEAAWRHARAPVEHQQRTELWHTRLTVVNPTRQRVQYKDERARLPVVWSPDFGRVSATTPDQDAKKPFLTSLTRVDRHDLVRLAHDSTACAEPIRADLLMLSPLGAWLKVEGIWPASPARDAFTTLEKWEHAVTMGRDQRAKIVRRAYLYPFGHQVTLVTETQRKPEIHPLGAEGAELHTAFLRQRIFVAIKERERRFTDPRDNPTLPFRSITILDDQTPNLNDPAKPSGGGIKNWGSKAFWPTVCNRYHEFRVQTVDWAGNIQEFTAPFIVVAASYVMDGGQPEIMRILDDVKPTYDAARPERYRQAGGQTLAYGRSRQKGDTEIEALTIGLNADLLPYEAPANPTSCVPFGPGGRPPPFKPKIDEAEARVPAINRLIPHGSGVAWFRPVDPDTGANPQEIFAAISRAGVKPNARFHDATNTSGGIVAPSPDIDALSRIYGPVNAAVLPAAALPARFQAAALPSFDPTTFFDPQAKVLGVVPLGKIIAALRIGAGNEVPSVLSVLTEGGEVPPHIGYDLEWETTALTNWPEADPIFEARAETRLAVQGGGYVWLLDENVTPEFVMDGVLEAFNLNVVFGGIGFVVVFNRVAFHAGTKRKAEFEVDIQKVEFKGAILELVAKLRSLLSFLDGDNALGLKVDVRDDGVVIGVPPLTIPPLQMGVFSLEQLLIANSCVLSFRNQPVLFRFDFSRRDAPFIVGVGVLGGTGFFAIEVDTQRIRAIEAALEFGAYKSLSFGVASGTVYVLGGLYYQSRSVVLANRPAATEVLFSAFVRAGGCVTALGFISVSVELLVSLNARSSGGRSSVWGTTSCEYSVKIGFFRRSFTITYTQEFQGSETDSALTLAGMMVEARALRDTTRGGKPSAVAGQLRLQDWKAYLDAFAA